MSKGKNDGIETKDSVIMDVQKAESFVQIVQMMQVYLDKMNGDALKVDEKNNQAACVRIRKVAQVLTVFCKEFRKVASERKNEISNSSKSTSK